MSRSAQSIQRSAYMMLGLLFFVGGGTFCYYLWTGTQIHDLNEAHGGRGADGLDGMGGAFHLPPALALKVEERTPGAVSIVATITNNNTVKLTIPDLLGIEPLYTVSLKYAPNKTDELHELPRLQSMQSRIAVSDVAAVPFNANRDVQIELLTGRAHAVALPIKQWYDIKPGHYEARVAFRPTDMVGEGDKPLPPLPPFNVSGASATIVFDYPLPITVEKPAVEKPAAAPVNSSVKTPDTAVKTVEVPAANK